MDTIILTKTKALPLIQEAYKNQLLGFQSETSRTSGQCSYRYSNGQRCGVGACLTDEQAAYLDDREKHGSKDVSIEAHIIRGTVEVDDEDFFTALQSAHDDLCDGDGDDPTELAAFEKLIDLVP